MECRDILYGYRACQALSNGVLHSWNGPGIVELCGDYVMYVYDAWICMNKWCLHTTKWI